MSKILVCGHKGSIGSRYMAIIKYLGHEAIGVDIKDGEYRMEDMDFDKAIVCTPTDTHFSPAYELAILKIPVLIEKPVSKQILEIKKIQEVTDQAWMVNNWSMVFPDIQLLPGNNTIEYDYYHTGSDGLEWDAIQLVYLANKLKIRTNAPFFDCRINGELVEINQLHHSYIRMIRAFIEGKYNNLWTLDQAIEANQKVEEYLGNSTSTNKQ